MASANSYKIMEFTPADRPLPTLTERAKKDDNDNGTAHSSSGLGRVPLKDEITGSNPVCATNATITPCFEAIPARQGVSF